MCKDEVVIIKGVSKKLTDEDLQKSQKEQFDGCKRTRFRKRDTTVLGTVEILFKTNDNVQKAPEHDLHIDAIYQSESLLT